MRRLRRGRSPHIDIRSGPNVKSFRRTSAATVPPEVVGALASGPLGPIHSPGAWKAEGNLSPNGARENSPGQSESASDALGNVPKSKSSPGREAQRMTTWVQSDLRRLECVLLPMPR